MGLEGEEADICFPIACGLLHCQCVFCGSTQLSSLSVTQLVIVAHCFRVALAGNTSFGYSVGFIYGRKVIKRECGSQTSPGMACTQI